MLADPAATWPVAAFAADTVFLGETGAVIGLRVAFVDVTIETQRQHVSGPFVAQLKLFDDCARFVAKEDFIGAGMRIVDKPSCVLAAQIAAKTIGVVAPHRGAAGRANPLVRRLR